MKKVLIVTIALFCFFSASYADIRNYQEQQIEVKDKKHYNEWNIPADMPDVYYNSELNLITIVDYVNATYYVTIYDDWWNVVITDTKVGGGTIDVSSLSSGDYTIEISTSWNHDFEGQFGKCI